LESPPPGGYPRPGALKVSIRNEHLQYAITWYGLAAVVIVMYAVWLAKRRAAGASPLPCGSKSSPLC
jgi:surfeit locus 1 family protein